MSAISLSTFLPIDLTPPSISPFSTLGPSLFSKSPSYPHLLSSSTNPRHNKSRRRTTLVFSKPSGEAEVSAEEEDEWLKKLPEKKKPLYSHSLPCIEAWLKQLGFNQVCALKALWSVEKPDWHAQLSLDVTDLYIRFVIFIIHLRIRLYD